MRAGHKGHRVRVDGEVGGDGQVGRDVGDRQGVVAADVVAGPAGEVVAQVGHGGDRGAVGAVIDRLRGRAGQRAVRPGDERHRVRVDGEVGGDGQVGGDVGDRQGVVAADVVAGPAGEVVAQVGYRRDRRAVAAVIDRLRGRAGEGAVRAGHKGHRVRVDGEVGGDGQVGRDVGDRQGVVAADVVAGPAGEVVAQVGYRRDRRAVAAVIDRLRGRAGQRAVRPGDERHRVRVDGEVGGDGQVGGDVGDRQGVVAADVVAGPAGEVVAQVGHGGDRGAVGAVIDRLRGRAGQRAVRPGDERHGVIADIGRRGAVARCGGRHDEVGRVVIGIDAAARQAKCDGCRTQGGRRTAAFITVGAGPVAHEVHNGAARRTTRAGGNCGVDIYQSHFSGRRAHAQRRGGEVRRRQGAAIRPD